MINASAGRIKQLLIFDREPQPVPDNATGKLVYKSLLYFYADFFKKLPAGIPLDIFIFYDIEFPFPRPAGLKQIHIVRFKKKQVRVCLLCTNLETGNPAGSSIPSGWVQDWIIPHQENKWFYSNPEDGLPDHLRQYLRMQLGDIQFQVLNEKCEGGNLLQGEQGSTKYLLAGGYNYTAADNAKLSSLFAIAPQNIIRINPILPGLKSENPHLFHLDLFISVIGQVNYPFSGKPDVLLVAKANGLNPDSDEINHTISHAIRDLKQHPSLNFVLIEIPFLVFRLFNLAYNNCHIQNYIDKGGRRISICFPSFIIPMQQLANELWDKNEHQLLEEYNTEIEQLLNVYPGNQNTQFVNNRKQEEYNTAPFIENLLNNIVQLNNNIEAEIRTTLRAIGIDKIEFISAKFNGLAYKRGSLHCMSLAIARE